MISSSAKRDRLCRRPISTPAARSSQRHPRTGDSASSLGHGPRVPSRADWIGTPLAVTSRRAAQESLARRTNPNHPLRRNSHEENAFPEFCRHTHIPRQESNTELRKGVRMRTIPIGAQGSFTLMVPERHASHFKDAILPDLLATPALMMVIENAALPALG